MSRTPTDDYLEKARKLGKADLERLLSRARNKLVRRLEDRKLTPYEVAAIQLEIEDEELAEWRERWAAIRKKEKEKKAVKA
ncbi:hypothetical protein F8A86_03315 [Betaproteobacteria bacterium SCN1]|jgi:hypothetical protein|nr:hypothetical protein F8A86_03315 [Betaproteobacteria bacterium SCN1]MBN8760493.1 hypothetical protein [Thiobacillus sp.]ODU88162.1 MAG: hypothetical protein ABT21_12300 [Thiobacillus sp. SCN 65-179]OJW36410.1 MAG: hypothetical protein BGO61_01655 [Thiobacillus sp. 65-69]